MRKYFKSVFCVLVLVMMVGAFVGCGSSTDEGEAKEDVATASRADYPDVPEEYTKVQEFAGTYGFGATNVVCAVNDDESKFHIEFFAFDGDNVLEGTVQNGVVTVEYDSSGEWFTKDGQELFDSADDSAWLTFE